MVRAAAAGWVIALALLAGSMPADAQKALSDPAAALQTMRSELQPTLRSNSFGASLYLSSRDEAGRSEGDVYAEVAHSFTDLGAAFKSAARVCELLILHPNVRACRAAAPTCEAAFVGVKGSAVSEGEEFASDVVRISGAEEALLGSAPVGAGLLGGHERKRNRRGVEEIY